MINYTINSQIKTEQLAQKITFELNKTTELLAIQLRQIWICSVL